MFCTHAEEILKASFNPTHIEIICKDLSDKLDKCTDERHLENWLELNFETFKPKMKNQVDFLDRQIDNSVSEIRQSTQLINEAILEVLKQIDSKLDNIRSQNAELRAAFRELNSINRQLEYHTLKVESNSLGKNGYNELKQQLKKKVR